MFISPSEYRVRYAQPLRAVDIQTYPYPGFPTDLQAPFTTVMTRQRETALPQRPCSTAGCIMLSS